MGNINNNIQEPAQFVWFASFTQALDKLPNASDRALMALAIYEYGALGKEPNFFDTKQCPAFVFASLFEALRPNIDTSVKNYTNGKKGGAAAASSGRAGRPKGSRNKPKTEVIVDDHEPVYIDCESELATYDPDAEGIPWV